MGTKHRGFHIPLHPHMRTYSRSSTVSAVPDPTQSIPFRHIPLKKHVPPLSPIFSPLFTPPHSFSPPPPPTTPYNIIPPAAAWARGSGARCPRPGDLRPGAGGPGTGGTAEERRKRARLCIQRVTQTNTNRTQNCGIHVAVLQTFEIAQTYRSKKNQINSNQHTHVIQRNLSENLQNFI